MTHSRSVAAACLTVFLFAACSNRPVPGVEVQTTTQALSGDGGPDLVFMSTVDAGFEWYTATLPVAAITGSIAQSIEGDWDATLHSTNQPPIYPQGWTLDYYAGATKLDAGPTTAAGWASISRIVTSGANDVEGVDGNRQALSSSITAPPPVIASSFSGGSSGDGWDVFFDPAHTKVFNIHHHSSPASVMCHNLADSSACPGFPINLTKTSSRATGYVDPISNTLWQPTTTPDSFLAWDCVDLNPAIAVRCATPVVKSTFHSANSSYENHVDIVVIGRKMYSVGFSASATTRITCLDMSTATECAGVQLIENGSLAGSGIDAIGNNLYVLAKSSGKLDCYDSTTMTRCSGAWPQQTTSTGRVHATPSPDGVLRNICADWQCWAADGSANTLPPNYLAYASANRENGLGCCGSYYANMGTGATRVAWAGGGRGLLQCWDMATDALCSPAFPFAVSRLYTAKFDPNDNDCLWTNSDDGIIRNYQVPTGAAGCSGGPPKISFKAALSIPRLGCDPASRVFEYKSFKLVTPDPSTYTSSTLTVFNSTGAPIPGWTNIAMASPTVDLTSLAVSVAGETPTFTVSATGLTDLTSIPAADFRVTTDSTPQLCWGLLVPTLTCPNVAGVAGNADAGMQVTDVVAKGTFTLDGGAVSSFTDQTISPTVNTNPANMTNCGGTLSAIVARADSTLVAGIQVFLLDATGAPVLDALSQPVSSISAVDGTVSFGLWPTGYELKVATSATYAPNSMTITAGGSGTNNATAGVVTSGVVTVTVGSLSSVSVVVSEVPPVAPGIIAPANGSLVNSATPNVTGTCINGDTVAVFEGETQLCSNVCAGSTFTCATSSLGDGSHTLAATQSNTGGASPNSGSTTFTVDTTPPAAPVILAPTEGLITNNNSPIFSGTCEPMASVAISESGAPICSAVCAAGGTFSCTSSVLLDGAHTVTAHQTDRAGNLGPNGPPRDFIVDTTPPVAPVIVAPVEGWITNNTTPTVSGTCETDASVTVMEGATLICGATCTAGNFSCVSSILANGTHALVASQTDLAGNLGPSSAPRHILVDTVPPVAPVIMAPLAGSSTNNNTPTISGSCEVGAAVSIFEGETTLCSATCSDLATFSCAASVLVDGPHAILANQIDTAGNLGPSSPLRNFIVDTVAPAVPVIVAPIEGWVTNNTTPTVSGTCENAATVNVFEGATLLCSSTCASNAFSCVSSVLTNGVHGFIASQRDVAGNISPSTPARHITVDNVPPAAPTIVYPTEGLLSDNNTPNVSGTCENGGLVQVYEGSALLCSATCSDSTFFCTSVVLSDATHALVARETDIAGNTSASSAVRTLVVDVTAPPAPVVTSPTEGAQVYDTPTVLSGTGEPGNTVTVSINGQVVCAGLVNGQGNWSCSANLTAGPSVATAVSVDITDNTSGPSNPVSFTQKSGIDAPQIVSPATNSTINGPQVTLTGTSMPASVVTIVDDTGATICTTTTDSTGAFQCAGVTSAGHRVFTAQAVWGNFKSNSAPDLVTVLIKSQFGGGGCGATGQGEPVAVLVMFVGAALLMFRRRAVVMMKK